MPSEHDCLESGRQFPNGSNISRDQILVKIKAIHRKYREAVDDGRCGGHGRIVAMHFERCEKICGGDPATEPRRCQTWFLQFQVSGRGTAMKGAAMIDGGLDINDEQTGASRTDTVRSTSRTSPIP